MPRILLGVCGGIAAYKALEFTRLALKAGHQRARGPDRGGHALRRARRRSPASPARRCSSPSGSRTRCAASFPGDPLPEHAPLSHLALVERADAYLIAPGDRSDDRPSSRTGSADNLLTAAALACRRPLIVAPAMNNAMYEHPATQANLATAARARRDRARAGHRAARLAGGVRHRPAARAARAAGGGGGRAPGRAANSTACNVLVTAGGTREPIDSVRFVGNRSSGRMGFALAAEAQRRGANVTVDRRQRVAASAPAGIEYVDVQTAAELADACAARFDACDVLLMAAAVADYRPEDAARGQAQEGRRRAGN